MVPRLSALREDYEYYCELTGSNPRRPWLFDALRNHSVMAGFWMRWACQARHIERLLVRSVLLTFFSSDVGVGATIAGPLNIPHPVGIVIGQGVRIGQRVRIFQHVTLGMDGSGNYPVIGNDVILFTGCIVVGGGVIADGTRINAAEVRVLREGDAA